MFVSAVDPGVYKAILRVRQAYAFDIGGMLMRFYGYMTNIGVVTMLTLAGYSFFVAGFVSSAIALAMFFVSPRISKRVDAKGQRRIVPVAALVTLSGLAVMLVTVATHGPEWVLFVAAVLMGFLPNPQALVRARWTYLIRTGKLGEQAPELRTMFSYEGVLDDIGFMFSPAISIALASAIAPVAGLLAGGVGLAAGVTLLTLSRSTEPQPGWKALDEEDRERAWAANLEGESAGVSDESALAPHQKSIIRTSPMVRVLFVLLMLVGAFFGVFDTSTVALAEQFGDPNIASVILMATAFISMVMGFAFGMVKLRMPLWKQLVACGLCIGTAYGTMALIDSVSSLYAVSVLGSFFYAPFLIVINSACEASVPGERLTEAITWINAGATCGMAFGPSVGGLLIDAVGATAGFDCGAVFAVLIPAVVLLFLRVIKRNVRG
ncbi:MFS transporter [Eggerthellaceae bacterium zg-887]|nr:MFS transporter [Xiamenia xianingshaonis]